MSGQGKRGKGLGKAGTNDGSQDTKHHGGAINAVQTGRQGCVIGTKLRMMNKLIADHTFPCGREEQQMKLYRKYRKDYIITFNDATSSEATEDLQKRN
ncbi:hypothetical protein CHS0354_042620 [Potamilus streckersoni]|uniref:Uncharacterized protein n=1 Tax=Potamilus streckersoni TaxID=2493646 RepID=A0AAE0TE81_9BIVA|nr:hypothetical protein CHS0354_042620 [Potamilus streckersoni]